ncbi:MAG: hypothetical protein ACLPWG_10740 [Steroidobacteraceae bacterium]
MNDTWVATPDPNSLLSTLAATFRTGAVAWLKVGGLLSNCAAPAAASLEFSDKDGAASLLGENLSAAVSSRVSSAWELVAAAAAAAACPDGIATAAAEIGAAFAGAASCGFTLASGVAKPTAADIDVSGVAALGASDAGVAPPTVAAAIAWASAPVSVESAAPFAPTVPGGDVARPVDADAAGAGAAFDAALSLLDARTAGLAAARTAALLINGVDPVNAALAPFEGSLAFGAPAAVVRVAAGGFGAEFMLTAATEACKPGAASEGAAAPCVRSVGACDVSMPRLFDDAVAAAASPAATSAAAGCAVAPADPSGAVMDVDPALDGGRGVGGAAAVAAVALAARIGAAAAVAVGAGAAAAVPAAADPAAGAPAAGGGGGKGDGEDLPATGRWPPLESTPAGVCAVVLRLGFAPASFNALAKSWLWAPIAAEFVAAALI